MNKTKNDLLKSSLDYYDKHKDLDFVVKPNLEKTKEYHKFINRPIIPEDKVDISGLLINYDF